MFYEGLKYTLPQSMVQTTSQVEVQAGNPPGLRAVAVASLISLVCIFFAIWSWMPSWRGFDRFPGLICILPFWIPYGFVLLRLYQGRIMSGMMLAGTMGCALFVPGVFLVRFVIEWQRSWWIVINLAVALLMQPVMVIATARALRYMQIPRRDWTKLSGSLVYGTVLFALFWLSFSSIPRQIIANEAESEDRLREISWNNALQDQKILGFDPESSALPINKVACDSNHLLYLLRQNSADGYNLAYRVIASKTSARGCMVDTRFIITARPVAYRKTGIRSFLVDQSKQDLNWPQVHSIRIHFTSADRPATPGDPADVVELFIHRPS
jgi:hypothetical protein